MKHGTPISIILAALLMASVGYYAYYAASRYFEERQWVLGNHDPDPLLDPHPSPIDPLAMRPRGRTIGEMNLMDLERAQGAVPFEIKVPDSSTIPEGLSLVGVSASAPFMLEWKSQKYNYTLVTLVYLHNPSLSMNEADITSRGGIIIRIGNAPGDNTTDVFELTLRPQIIHHDEQERERLQKQLDGWIAQQIEMKNVTVGYLWGNPSKTSSGHISLYDFANQMNHSVEGNYSYNVLLSIMESIISDTDARVSLGPGDTGSPLIEEAKALVHDIPLKSPDRSKFPEGFNVKEILYRRSRNTYEFEGKEFTPEHLWIFLWNKTLGNTPFKDFLAGGGISIAITYGPGSNETGTFIYTNMKPGGDFSYLWGYPTVSAEGHLQHFNFDTGISYTIKGNYPTQVLIRVLESLL